MAYPKKLYIHFCMVIKTFPCFRYGFCMLLSCLHSKTTKKHLPMSSELKVRVEPEFYTRNQMPNYCFAKG